MSTSTSLTLLSRIFNLYRPHARGVVCLLFTLGIAVCVGLLPPILLKTLIDEGLGKNNFKVTTLYTVYSVLATVATSLVTVYYGLQSVLIGQKIITKLRGDLFDHLSSMSIRFFTCTRSGEIETRLCSDMDAAQRVIADSFIEILSNVSIILSSLAAMFILDWRLALLSISFMPFLIFAGDWVSRRGGEIHSQVISESAAMASMIHENLSISGAMLNKTVGRFDVLSKQFTRQVKKVSEWHVRGSLHQYIFFFGLFPLVCQILPVIILWFAGWLMSSDKASFPVGLLMAFAGLQVRMSFPLTLFMSHHYDISRSFVSFERIFEYFDMRAEITDSPSSILLERHQTRGEIIFDHVWFRYDSSNSHWTLREINFTASPGQLIALVGPTGAGKTSVTHLISRLYDAEIGKVKLDGMDVRDIRLECLQRLIAVVSQDTFFFNTSIANNLRIANPAATDEQLTEACQAAAIHDQILELKEGYETVVGERGYKLSGGEKQRLSIARALLKDPKILILDEATSALDTESERLIQISLARLMKGRTTFAIAHRLSTIEDADLIVVVENGAIVESGTHATLVRAGERYAQLARKPKDPQPSLQGAERGI